MPKYLKLPYLPFINILIKASFSVYRWNDNCIPGSSLSKYYIENLPKEKIKFRMPYETLRVEFLPPGHTFKSKIYIDIEDGKEIIYLDSYLLCEYAISIIKDKILAIEIKEKEEIK